MEADKDMKEFTFHYEDSHDDGVVEGKIRNNMVEGRECYSITILVNGTIYIIDPQLRMT